MKHLESPNTPSLGTRVALTPSLLVIALLLGLTNITGTSGKRIDTGLNAVSIASTASANRWVALGDSYSSGEGTSDYDQGTTDPKVNMCRRSRYAWPRVLANRPQFAFSLAQQDHVACSGAVTADITNAKKEQFSSRQPCPANTTELSRLSYPRVGTVYTCEVTWARPQIDSLDDPVRLATITIGGNDVNFADIGLRCAFEPVTEPIPIVGGCIGQADLDKIKAEAFSKSLRDTYRAILTRATNAKVVVVGYPPVLYRDPCGMLTDDSHTILRNFIASLNVKAIFAVQDVQAESPDFSQRLSFAPIKTFPAVSAWQDRGICRNASYPFRIGVAPGERINRIWQDPLGYNYRNSFHPNVDGFSAIANVVQSFVEGKGGQDLDRLPPRPTGGGTDTELVIDTSGSMSSNDPTNQRIEAGRAYLNATLASDYVGVIDFDDSARIAQSITPVATNRDALVAALDSLDSSGGTNIGDGVQKACDDLQQSQSGNLRKAAILFTDGDGAFSGQDDCFTSHSWPIFAFGLGTANDALLQGIADRTGGEYRRIGSIGALSCEFQRVRSKIAGVAAVPCESKTIQQGATLTQLATVGPRQSLATFSIAWPGSDVQLSLTTPSGATISRDDLLYDVRHENGPTFETYSVADPEPGEWTLSIFGAVVNPGGEPVTIASTSLPNELAVPVPRYSANTEEGSAPLVVRFDGSSSTSGNGRIVSWVWNFQDGTGLEAGADVSHEFKRGGTFRPVLVVTDEVGERAQIEGSPIVVAGPTIVAVPSVQLQPPKGSSATDITLTGTSCGSPGASGSSNFVSVDITRDGSSLTETTSAAAAEADGTWTVTFRIPGTGPSTPAAYTIGAHCHVNDAELFAYPEKSFLLDGGSGTYAVTGRTFKKRLSRPKAGVVVKASPSEIKYVSTPSYLIADLNGTQRINARRKDKACGVGSAKGTRTFLASEASTVNWVCRK